jgi:hypothetical protein
MAGQRLVKKVVPQPKVERRVSVSSPLQEQIGNFYHDTDTAHKGGPVRMVSLVVMGPAERHGVPDRLR